MSLSKDQKNHLFEIVEMYRKKSLFRIGALATYVQMVEHYDDVEIEAGGDTILNTLRFMIQLDILNSSVHEGVLENFYEGYTNEYKRAKEENNFVKMKEARDMIDRTVTKGIEVVLSMADGAVVFTKDTDPSDVQEQLDKMSVNSPELAEKAREIIKEVFKK